MTTENIMWTALLGIRDAVINDFTINRALKRHG